MQLTCILRFKYQGHILLCVHYTVHIFLMLIDQSIASIHVITSRHQRCKYRWIAVTFWKHTCKCKCRCLSSEIPVSSADFSIYTTSIWTFSCIVLSPLGKIQCIHNFQMFIPPGRPTHYCWVGRCIHMMYTYERVQFLECIMFSLWEERNLIWSNCIIAL